MTMRNVKKLLLVFTTVLLCGSYDGYGQIYVTVRPHAPHYERIVAPSPRHVWVDEEWVERNGRYEWGGGHWVLPPRQGVVWIPGHWEDRPRGSVWIHGHWGRARRM